MKRSVTAAIFCLMTHQEAAPRRYTAEEYFTLEMKSEARHDFINGQIIERPVDTDTHKTIVGNCLMAFQAALQYSESHVYTLGSLLVLRENEYYTYPNLMVCGEDEGASEIALIRRPQLLLDVLSPETEDHDRGQRFKLYRQLPSLQHHILMSQATRLVEWYRRNDGGEWVITEPDEILTIAELSLRLTVAEVYEETDVVQLRVLPPDALEPEAN